jgi:hypothetical protein
LLQYLQKVRAVHKPSFTHLTQWVVLLSRPRTRPRSCHQRPGRL